jgi:ribosomal protein S18 acetylase RimI-like enzyme
MNKVRIQVRQYRPADQESVVRLVAEFRVVLSCLWGHERKPDLSSAEAELQEYIEKSYPIFVATSADEANAVGYLVCRMDGDTVWVESLFVAPRLRRRGIAGQLYQEAEKLAQDQGQETLYNWIHPSNDAIIAFLKKRGYDVLNLIEIRRRRAGEKPETTLKVGNHNFAY